MTEDEDDMETARMDSVSPWLSPVTSKDQLPRKAAEGALCFVKGSDTVFQFKLGKWVELGPTAERR